MASDIKTPVDYDSQRGTPDVFPTKSASKSGNQIETPVDDGRSISTEPGNYVKDAPRLKNSPGGTILGPTVD